MNTYLLTYSYVADYRHKQWIQSHAIYCNTCNALTNYDDSLFKPLLYHISYRPHLSKSDYNELSIEDKRKFVDVACNECNLHVRIVPLKEIEWSEETRRKGNDIIIGQWMLDALLEKHYNI